MTEKTIPVPEIPSPPKKRRRSVKFLIILLIAMSALSYFLWHRSGQLQRQTDQQIKPLIAQVAILEQQLKEFQSQNEQKLEKSLQVFDQQYKILLQQQQRLQDNLAVLTHQVQQPQDNTQWLIAEIGYLIQIAHQRLLLMKDVEGASTALIAAQQRLSTLNHPALSELKLQLTQDIERLHHVKRPPIKESAQRLAHYMTQAEQLPLAQGQRSADPPSNPISNQADKEIMTTIWQQVSQLITIRYRSKTEGEFLTTEQRYFVIQTLRLKLELARIFLLSQDFEHFTAALITVQDWLDRYYDQNDDSVKKLVNDLKEMQAETGALPDISATLNALQHLTTVSLLPKVEEAVSP